MHFFRCKVVPFSQDHMCSVVYEDVTAKNSYDVSGRISSAGD